MTYAENNSCTGQQPRLIKSIENWDIIADNTAQIKLAPYFSGEHLTYSLSYKHLKKSNRVTINSHSGELMIDAQKRDNFDLKITASNPCGVAKGKFNVQIDEEE